MGNTTEGARTLNLAWTYRTLYVATKCNKHTSTSTWGNASKVRANCYKQQSLSQIVTYVYSDVGIDIVTIGY